MLQLKTVIKCSTLVYGPYNGNYYVKTTISVSVANQETAFCPCGIEIQLVHPLSLDDLVSQ